MSKKINKNSGDVFFLAAPSITEIYFNDIFAAKIPINLDSGISTFQWKENLRC